MSPRRSSRARTTQPPTSLQSHTLSSSSSTSSGRADRSTRSHHKIQSPQKSTPSRSRSSEEVDETTKVATTEPLQTRRRKRERGEDEQVDAEPSRDTGRHGQGDDGDEEEEEITRCICGYQEYPGPPVPIANHSIELDVDPKLNIKDELNLDASMTVSEVPSEESGGWFIQCDTCKVWQHGGCVGIMDGSMTPDDYFCELCRRDFHKITIGPNGQRSSRYLPVLENFSPVPQRSISRSKDRDSKASSNDRSNRPSTGSNQTKRRATMNSRDAAYDEEELLRRAIEESKREGKKSANFDTGSRREKRGRSDSEDLNHESKRQRTTSMSPDPTQLATSQIGDSEDDTPSNKNSTSSGGKRIRGAAARNQREKELRDREIDKEKERADAVGRRKGRAERRRGDESDPSDEFPLSRTASAKGIAETSQPPDTGPSSQQPRDNTPPSIAAPAAATSSSHRKTGRPPARRGRVGRNQYTKDRDLPNDGVSGENGIASPLRSQSRDGPLLDEALSAASQTNGNGTHTQSNGQALLCPDGSKPSKPRYMHPQRTSMNEMKKRVNSILEFISRVQLDMAGERTPPAGTSSGPSLTTSAMLRSIGEGTPMGLMSNGTGDAAGSGGDERDFSQLQTEEMMDVLTRKLILWQKEFGKYGEK